MQNSQPGRVTRSGISRSEYDDSVTKTNQRSQRTLGIHYDYVDKIAKMQLNIHNQDRRSFIQSRNYSRRSTTSLEALNNRNIDYLDKSDSFKKLSVLDPQSHRGSLPISMPSNPSSHSPCSKTDGKLSKFNVWDELSSARWTNRRLRIRQQLREEFNVQSKRCQHHRPWSPVELKPESRQPTSVASARMSARASARRNSALADGSHHDKEIEQRMTTFLAEINKTSTSDETTPSSPVEPTVVPPVEPMAVPPVEPTTVPTVEPTAVPTVEPMTGSAAVYTTVHNTITPQEEKTSSAVANKGRKLQNWSHAYGNSMTTITSLRNSNRRYSLITIPSQTSASRLPGIMDSCTPANNAIQPAITKKRVDNP